MDPKLTRNELESLREYFAARQNELIAFIRALVETESPSGDNAGSSTVAKMLAEAARGIAAVSSVERIPVPDFGEHVRIRAFEEVSDAPPIVLLGHTDTVHPRGTIDQRPWRVKGNRIYGPGVFDMKSSCALALELLRCLSETGFKPRSPLTVMLMCDEESGSLHGRAL